MAQVITGLDNIPLSAISAAYAPTNTADVTAMIDSAVSGKLDASASSSFQPVGNYVSSDDLSAYQTTAGMSAYATTGDLTAKLDASASSSFITSTSDCMPLSSSSEYYSTSNPSGFVTSSYSPTFGYYNGNISSIDGTGLMGTDTAIVSTNTVQSFANIESGLPFEDTVIFDTPVTSIKITVPDEPGTEPWFNLNADNPAGDETVLAYVGDSYYTYSTSLGGSGWTSISFYDTDYLSQGGIRYISATGYSDGVTATAELMKLSAMSAYLPTSAIGVDTASSLITGINGSALSAGSTYSAGQYVQISGDEISVTGLQPSGSYVSSTDLSAYQPTADMSAYATTGDLSAKLDASASSSFLTAQEQASWSETASASPSYIVDKPDLVDIVAGPGIVVDNPDGNTLRVSMADPTVDVVRDCENWNGHTMKCIILRGAYTTNTSMQNQYIENVLPVGTTIAFIDGSNSYVVYGGNPQINMMVPYCIDYNRLFSPWVDITNRRVNLRYIDVSNNVTCTYYLCVKYAVD